MTAINNTMRESAIRALERELRDSQAKLLAKEEDRLARAVYNKIVPPARAAALSRIPREFFYCKDTVHVCIDGHRVQLAFADKKARPLPAMFRERVCVDIPGDYEVRLTDKLRVDIKAHREKKDADVKTRKELLREARTVLNCCRTIKQLREAWPDAERLFPQCTPPAAFPLVPRVEELNAKLHKITGRKPRK